MEMKKSHHNTRQNHSNHHQNTWCITSAKCDLRMDSVNGNEHILIVRSSISKGNEYDDQGEEATKEPPPDTPPTATQHPQEDIPVMIQRSNHACHRTKPNQYSPLNHCHAINQSITSARNNAMNKS
eukprot:485793_1